MIDVDELYHLWTVEKLAVRAIVARLHVPESTLERTIRNLRRNEGLERWPLRAGAIRTPSVPVPPKRLKRGVPTLPPLGSLE